MKRISNILSVFYPFCFLFTILLLCSNCTKELDSYSSDLKKTGEGICIYPIKSMLVTFSEADSDNFRTIEQLGDEPYINYSDIQYYDTVFHIIQLKYTITRLIQKLGENNSRFAVTLNGEILYRGSFVYKSPIMSSDEPVIILNDAKDTLGPNKIRIYQQFPIFSTDNYNDLRYQPELNKLLKSDKKACGSLFNAAKPNSIVNSGSGIEFYFIEGITSIEGISDFSQANLINGNIHFENLRLAATPFIADSQIAFYDSAQNIFYLREPLDFSNYTDNQIITKFYAITINQTPAVIGGFYLMMYSYPCPYIHTFPDGQYQNPINKYLLRLYPGSYTKNPACTKINSPLLIQKLSQDGKLKNNFII